MAITGWTDVVNSFVAGTSAPHSSRTGADGYAQGGAFASSEIAQEVAITDGYRVGAIAVLHVQRANAIADDTGQVVLEALASSGGTVLATTSTAVEAMTLNTWTRRRLTLAIPVGATYLRVRLVANRAAGSGNSGAAFDDAILRVHKDLDPGFEIAFDFTAPRVQPTPSTWQRLHLAWPPLVPDVLVAQGSLVISAHQQLTGESIAWSDGAAPAGRRFVAQLGDGIDSLDSFAFTRAAAVSAKDVLITGTGTVDRGMFGAAYSFWVRVVLKVDELGFASACGVVGRRNGTGIGWGIQIDASGHAKAVLQGASGIKTATSTSTVHEGAAHQLVLAFDATARTLRIYVDRRGYNETDTTSGMGEFFVAAGTPVRIGRDSTASETGTIQVLEVELFDGPADADQVAAMWTLGSVDTEVATVVSAPVWVPLPDDSNGARLVRCAVDEAPIGYANSAYGLALARGSTNLIPSNDVSTWTLEAGVVAGDQVFDVTGLERGIQIFGSPTAGIALDVALGTDAGLVNVVIYVQGFVLDPTVTCELLDDADNVKDSGTADGVFGHWRRLVFAGLAWDGASATGKLRIRSSTAFLIAHVAWAEVSDVARVPAVIQDAGVALANVRATVAQTYPVQLNHEGEVDVAGIATMHLPAGGLTILDVQNGSNSKNRRQLITVTGGDEAGSPLPRFRHWDGASSPASVDADAAAISWEQEWRLRGRWCRTSIPSGASDKFAGILVDASVDTDAQNARTAAWTVEATANDETRIGGSSSDKALDGYIRRLAIRAREERL